MLTQSDIERERYESRRKAQMDHISAINAARLEGELAGREMGELIGAIHLCQTRSRLVRSTSVQSETRNWSQSFATR
jgi:hypothetical protein